ncbi:Paf1 [Aspergillus parasiticus SU-1]|uniref:Paf1 n=1 Tax=Aspergillus parasiticus (strain ATCC 56775 / NRRL 5862 / SRRC 143 / SU-1) TaxID=1403190 RepID=A0A0F0I2W2_ASPPU|nr:Paf1 [Aspergillus parasiticus SU-1]
MVGKKSGKALLRDEGLERTDNNMELSSWPQIPPINQKNYYTDYLKRDDQYLAFRLQNEEARNRMTKTAKDRDRALAMAKANDLGIPEADADDGDTNMEDAEEATAETVGSKVIVIHVGSQNLRIGLASDALPKTVPMVIARKSTTSESEDREEPCPKRLKTDDGSELEPEKMFGSEFSSQYTTMSAELKTHMRQNKRRTLPNSKEMVINYNRRTVPETISEHNDPMRVEWTEIPDVAPEYIVGQAALRIPDESTPRYKLYWPMKYGWCNERDYKSKRLLFLDISLIIEDAIKNQLGLTSKKDWLQYSCVFVIPDLYEKSYVTQVLEMLMREFSFARVCFIQESLAATFGAGFTSACVVDIGAQKTSICCVEEGMCIENSRVNLKYGGSDVTEAFVKMMLYDHFPYADINLWRRYDFLLAEELKKNICTMNEASVSVQVFDFHLRIAGQDTRKYNFKAYDEVHLAPMGYFQPSIFDHSLKLNGRRKLISRSVDIYDGQPNDPTSAAQSELLTAIAPPITGQVNGDTLSSTLDVQSTPSRSQQVNALSRLQEAEATPRSSVAGSPAPDVTSTPQAGGAGTPAVGGQSQSTSQPRAPTVEERDDILPTFPLDSAILMSIAHAARSDERKMRDFLGGIMVVGGGSLINGFHSFLEERLQALRPGFAKEIMIGTPPRDLDPQVVVWKGASVFGKLSGTNDSWIGQLDPNKTKDCDSADRAVSDKEISNLILSSPLISPLCIETQALETADSGSSNMSKTKDGSSSGGFHQEYIASLRYRNDLPPPDMPPKFLDIPHDGLERFLTPGFASNLARREEPNIDVDAEGGMPIDLVGIPGLHLGDESAIMAPENPDPIDPADLPLLMTLDQLKNPAPRNTNVSFLRRTQYISAGLRAPEGPKVTPMRSKSRQAEKAKSQDDPAYIKKYIQKGFDIAYPDSKHAGEDTPSQIKGHMPTKLEVDAWANPVHPDNPKLKPVGFYPLMPDLQGFPDPGGFVQFKFDKAPIQDVSGKRDRRIDTGILLPSAPEERVCEEHATKVALHKTNPKLYPDPGPIPWDYDLFLPEKKDSIKKVLASMQIYNPDRDNEELYTHEGSDNSKFHRFDRMRTFATSAQTLGGDNKQKDIAVTLFDPSEAKEDYLSSKQKAAYYYPILGKTRLKPERARTIAQAGLAPTRPKTKEDQVDQIQVVVRDPDEMEVYKRSLHRAAIDPKFAKTMPPPPEAANDEHESPEEGDKEAVSGDREQSVEEADRMSDE